MNVYLAGQYARKHELREYASQLKSNGIKVGAEWLNEPEAPTSKLHESTLETKIKYSDRDRRNVAECDVMVFFSEPQDEQPPRGGRHVEFGMALALGKPIVVVGQPENIFHYLPGTQIEFFDNWDGAREFLGILKDDWINTITSDWGKHD